MIHQENKEQQEQQEQQEQKKQPVRRFQSCTKKKKNTKEISILSFCANRDFLKFSEALSNKVLKEYGNLGKLIKQLVV